MDKAKAVFNGRIKAPVGAGDNRLFTDPDPVAKNTNRKVPSSVGNSTIHQTAKIIDHVTSHLEASIEDA